MLEKQGLKYRFGDELVVGAECTQALKNPAKVLVQSKLARIKQQRIGAYTQSNCDTFHHVEIRTSQPGFISIDLHHVNLCAIGQLLLGEPSLLAKGCESI
ncbi:hypothetical protein WJ42_37535 [Burkholderia cepacia]|nr:hypothetical protein WJ42_37535 [Burkholderia cepacia]KWC70684.1 hypothetical protein WL55_12720 [Burkholderia cepacia]